MDSVTSQDDKSREDSSFFERPPSTIQPSPQQLEAEQLDAAATTITTTTTIEEEIPFAQKPDLPMESTSQPVDRITSDELVR